ncbi:hypothetical protein TRFO_29843 [Tritrichomonas foetus]|uniref:Uncharacterized protein n=1 Tax=Tritrichomonas foetus TaxID=1144522 RepID=A0A1J4JZG1_9EUKA|nr:hypothetical protein TRFO_29843 [Tritrichomonas foetus]|eukprot:OHT02916.1 hypothetical protein TRFO_29843 [Tritrichomonas foetus]
MNFFVKVHSCGARPLETCSRTFDNEPFSKYSVRITGKGLSSKSLILKPKSAKVAGCLTFIRTSISEKKFR